MCTNICVSTIGHMCVCHPFLEQHLVCVHIPDMPSKKFLGKILGQDLVARQALEF